MRLYADEDADSGLSSAQAGVVIFGLRKYPDNMIKGHLSASVNLQ